MTDQKIMDPVEHEGFNKHVARPANPARISRIQQAAAAWRATVEVANEARRDLETAVAEAHAAGHSFAQMRDACGLSISSVQAMIAKREKEEK